MSKHRPHALKFSLCLILVSMAMLSACNANPQTAAAPTASETSAPPTQTPAAIRILNLESSATTQPVPSSTPTEYVQPGSTQPSETVAPAQKANSAEPNCVTLRDPEDGSNLPAYGWLTFAWDAWPEATNYLLEITTPSGWVLSVETLELQNTRALEALTSGGDYYWWVSALDADRQVLCQAGPYHFRKPEYQASSAPAERPDYGPEPGCNCIP